MVAEYSVSWPAVAGQCSAGRSAVAAPIVLQHFPGLAERRACKRHVVGTRAATSAASAFRPSVVKRAVSQRVSLGRDDVRLIP